VGEPSGRLFGLRGKLLMTHMAVIFVTIAALAILLLSLVQGYLLDAMEDSLQAQAVLITRALIPGADLPETGSTDELSPAVNTLQQQQFANLAIQVEQKDASPDGDASAFNESNLSHLGETTIELGTVLESRILLVDARGIAMIDSSQQLVGADLHTEPGIQPALGGLASTTRTEHGGETQLVYSAPITVDGEVEGVVQIAQPLNDLYALLIDLRIRLLLASAVALPVAALVALLLARGIASPMRALTSAALAMSAGDFDHPVPSAEQDEIGQLAKAFDRMRTQIQSVEAMRTRFVSDVSHELRTPLTSVKGLIETLRDGAVDDPAVRDRFLASIEAETDRLIRLVNDLLTLSRADGGALTLMLETVDLDRCVTRSLERVRHTAERNGITLTHQRPDPPVFVAADPDRMEQALLILLDNALKFSPPGAEVLIGHAGFRVQREGGRWTGLEGEDAVSHQLTRKPPHSPGSWHLIYIADSGMGISPEHMPHVFERFYRGDPARSHNPQGSGLGLSIADAIISAHGGQIWLESPSPHLPLGSAYPGTVACISLPALEAGTAD
jgi:signal transduction histidine kinase